MKWREKILSALFAAVFVGLVFAEASMGLAVAHVEPFCRCCDRDCACPECPQPMK